MQNMKRKALNVLNDFLLKQALIIMLSPHSAHTLLVVRVWQKKGQKQAASNLSANEFCRIKGRVCHRKAVSGQAGEREGLGWAGLWACNRRPQHKFFIFHQQQRHH